MERVEMAFLRKEHKENYTCISNDVPIGDGEIIVVRMNHTFVEEYEKWA